MRQSLSTLTAALLMTAAAAMPAFAQQVQDDVDANGVHWFNPWTEPLQEPQVQEEQKTPVPEPQPEFKKTKDEAVNRYRATGLTVMDTGMTVNKQLKDIPQMQILGLWVGNMGFKVGTADGRLYLIAPNGRLKLFPKGTDPDDIAVPQNSPVVSRMLPDSSTPELKENNGAKVFLSNQQGLLRPTVMGTKTAMLNGEPAVVGGAIICELPAAKTMTTIAKAPEVTGSPEKAETSKSVKSSKKTVIRSHRKHSNKTK